MRVFGIDCGTEITGYGVVETCDTARESRIICKAMGEIRLLKTESTAQRLHHVFRELTTHLEQWCPEVVAIEEVFYSVNVKSALKLGQVRGVALLAAAVRVFPSPNMLRCGSSPAWWATAWRKRNRSSSWWPGFWAWPNSPQPADAADALAIAICHIHTAQTLDAARSRAMRLFSWQSP